MCPAAPTPWTAAPPPDLAGLRAAVVAAQAATLLITWPSWQTRLDPPLLPLLPLPAVPFGAALLASLALVLLRPRLGTVLHALLLALAIAADQTREQPQVLSLALLLGAATFPSLRTVGALHLVALWLWSGLGKLLSVRFLAEGGAWLCGGAAAAGSPIAVAAAALLGAGELTLGLLALCARTRRAAAGLGACLHVSILLYLLLRGANPAVWPWNAALCIAAAVLLGGSRGTLAGWWRHGAAVRCAVVLFVLLPLGYHAGLVDRAFAHSVYTQDGPRAVWLHGCGRIEEVCELRELRVSLPAVPRVQEAFFAHKARSGDALAIVEPRLLARALGARDRLLQGPVAPGIGP